MSRLTLGLSALLTAALAAPPATASPTLGDRLAPRAFRAAAARVQPSIVTVETAGTIGINRTSKKQRQRIGGLGNPGEGPSTGLIVSPDGLILTSTFHFIRKPRIITVTLADGRQFVAELLGRDDTRKLCVLKLKDETVSGLPVAPIAPADELRVGEWAISLGAGYGGDHQALSAGIISALERAGGRAVQTDANISPANYGGPLVDITGRVIGLCVPLNPRAGGSAASGSEWYDSGIGFAIPLDGIDPLITRMAAGEHLKRGLIGIQPSAKVDGKGVRIERVATDSPASDAGLQKGDLITRINDQPVLSVADVSRSLGKFVAGDRVVITFRRGDDGAADVLVTLGAGPYKFDAPKATAIDPPDIPRPADSEEDSPIDAEPEPDGDDD